MRSPFVQTVLPFCVFLLLIIISVISSVEIVGSGWIPLVGGFANTEVLDRFWVSLPLICVSLVVILLGLYMVLLKTNAIPFWRCALLFLMFVAANPHSLYFNPAYPVLASLLWAQYCLLERQVFAAYMLLSLASLFYAPAIWLVPAIMLLVPFSGMPEQLRIFVKSISGACIPHLYLLTFRWMKFDDAQEFLHHFFIEATDVGLPFHSLGMPEYFMLLLVCYVLFRAISFIILKNPMSTLEYLLKMEIMMLCLNLGMAILFGGNNANVLFILFFMPVAVILSYYFKNCEKTGRTNIELLILSIAAFLCGLSYLV